jgi:hypothetical protein
LEVPVRSIPFLGILALPLANVSAAPVPAAPQAGPPPLETRATPGCREPGATFASEGRAGKGQVATRVQKLGELPPANHYLAVVRDVGGCPEPAIVRTGIRG